MKKLLVVMIVVVAIALVSAGVAMAGISSTRHNLSSSASWTIRAAAGQTNEICVFCHTPHNANTGFLGAPLWNKTNSASVYTLYGTTVGGNTTATLGAISKACLSCHDGSSAINSVVNAPGSGMGSGTVNMNGGTTVMPAGATNLGTDLRNDHPVGITYDVTAPVEASLYGTATALTGSWVGAVTIADLLRNGQVECSSCHEPHSSQFAEFLRADNANGSKLCLGCHNK